MGARHVPDGRGCGAAADVRADPDGNRPVAGVARSRMARRRAKSVGRTAGEVRLQLHALAYNLGNFMRTLAMPKAVEPWSLTSLREKLVKIGAKVVSHGRYVTFQMAEVAV